jgi:P-type Ca2+ transporter type 2C
MNTIPEELHGLTAEEVNASRTANGSNAFSYKKENSILKTVKDLARDPMLLLLLTASLIYFTLGDVGDGLFLCGAVIFQTSISLYQSKRSKNALDKLKQYSQPNSKVLRAAKIEEIKSEEIVVGDLVVVEEGALIPADGEIVQSNDFEVSEAVVTGESLAVNKSLEDGNNDLFSGTTVISGSAIFRVTKIGNQTKIGQIGKSLESIEEIKTPLELKIGDFVKKMALLGAAVFLLVWGINFWNTREILSSLLYSLTLAMSILPEEIPVAFTTFMALGAWRLMKMGIVVKQMKTVETLGSATVICTDKTGTITENKMEVAEMYTFANNETFSADHNFDEAGIELLEISMWASEPMPFDPMEIALHNSYGNKIKTDQRPDFQLIHEYKLEGKPPMMTHVFENKNGERIIAAKGAPEAFFQILSLDAKSLQLITEAMKSMASKGYRILGVGKSDFSEQNFPSLQTELPFTFLGLVAFYDPPKSNISEVLKSFYKAGIEVKIITGDNALTTQSIAKQIDFKGWENTIDGEELMKLDDESFKACVAKTSIFTRMFPEAKLKIINSLKENQQIVAMTGDGVNDGPALKAAHIGISMGSNGTEIAKQSSSLILLENDLSKMVDAIAMGRKIYSNLKKAIQYIISIHIPIILTVLIPLALDWTFTHIFSPIHIIFLEVIMGPTCSIIYENEPMEANAMSQKPKPLTSTFFNWKELSISIIQGVVITLGTLFVYQWGIMYEFSESAIRTSVFTTLISANIGLTLVNRSPFFSVFTTLKYKNRMVIYIIAITISVCAVILFIPVINQFFEFTNLSFRQLFLCVGTGLISVLWIELYKFYLRNKALNKQNL